MKVVHFRQPRTPRTGELQTDLAHEVLARPIPTPNWAIAGLCCELDHVLISGDGGIGKTLMGLHVALALATARPVFGTWAVTRPHRVAYLDLEDHRDSIDERVHRCAAGLGIDAAPPFELHLIRERLVLDDDDDADFLLKFIRARAIEWLFIDSHAAAMDGDTSSQQDVAYFHRVAIHPLREAGCASWITDHTRKLTGDRARDEPGESIIGARRKRNAADVHVGVVPAGDLVAWKPTKNRHGARGEAIKLRIEQTPAQVSISVVGRLERAADDTQTALLGFLANGPQLRTALVTLAKRSEKTTQNALTALHDAGFVTKEKVGDGMLYALAKTPDGNDGKRTAK